MCIRLCGCSANKVEEDSNFLISDNQNNDTAQKTFKTATKVYAGVGIAMALSMALIKAGNVDDLDIDSPKSDNEVESPREFKEIDNHDTGCFWYHFIHHFFHFHQAEPLNPYDKTIHYTDPKTGEEVYYSNYASDSEPEIVTT